MSHAGKGIGQRALDLRVGDRVTVRPLVEILATLDPDGRLDALPFMPEMTRYCGQEFTVFKRIDKINDTVDRTGLRRMKNAVILDGVRCAGNAHGGCQALCQLIWKEAWLVRSSRPHGPAELVPSPACSAARLNAVTRQTGPTGDERFLCQATEIKNASTFLAWWDVRQDLRDLRSGNVGVGELLRYLGRWLVVQLAHRLTGGTRFLVPLYNALQDLRGGERILPRQGALDRTPTAGLNLQAGELVKIKTHEEIVATLDKRNKNRGLWFDLEMVKYCGGTYRVLSRVERIIDHKTGGMVRLPNECLILEGVTIRGDHHRFYPQNEYPFWREIWMRRVADARSLESNHRKAAYAEARD